MSEIKYLVLNKKYGVVKEGLKNIPKVCPYCIGYKTRFVPNRISMEIVEYMNGVEGFLAIESLVCNRCGFCFLYILSKEGMGRRMFNDDVKHNIQWFIKMNGRKPSTEEIKNIRKLLSKAYSEG